MYYFTYEHHLSLLTKEHTIMYIKKLQCNKKELLDCNGCEKYMK